MHLKSEQINDGMLKAIFVVDTFGNVQDRLNNGIHFNTSDIQTGLIISSAMVIRFLSVQFKSNNYFYI